MDARIASPVTNTLAPLRVLAIALTMASILAIMGASQSQGYYAIHHGTPPPWSQSLLWSAAQWYAWALFVPFIVAIGLRLRFGAGAPVLPRVLLHALLALFFAFAHLLLQAGILWFLLPGGKAFLGSFATGVLTLFATGLQWELLSYAAVLAITHVVLYVRDAQTEALARREVETQAARAQLATLKRQMQPHFLFNALNALVSMQGEDSAEQRFTIRLADFLRLLLAGDDSASATLTNELMLVEAYLHIERIRLGSRLQTIIEVPEALRGARLPSLILQPLVENAIIHGVARDPAGGEIRVMARRSAAEVVVEIVNTCRSGFGQERNRGHGMALDNCRQRLALMYGAAARIEAGPVQAQGFRAAIFLPAASIGAPA